MAVVWPPTLEQAPLLDSYQETPPEIVLRSTVDAGPPKVRRRFTANVSIVRCAYSLTRAQLAIFDDFYFGPAGGGSVAFEWPHPWKHVTIRVRFREVPSYSNAGHPEDAWTVGVVLEVLPPGDARVRTLSAAARAALFAGETEQIFLCLLVIEEVGLDGPLRFVNNTEPVFSRAHGEVTPQEYLAWPFRLMLPDERDDQPLGPRIEIDNVDPRIMAAVRPLASPPYLTVYIVLASTPDLVEAGPIAGRLTAVDYNASTISASISGPPVLVEPFPYRTFTPGDWPGVHR